MVAENQCRNSKKILCRDVTLASHSRGTKPPYWRAKNAAGQDKQKKLPF